MLLLLAVLTGGVVAALAGCAADERTAEPTAERSRIEGEEATVATGSNVENTGKEEAGENDGVTERMSLREMVGQMFVVSVGGTGTDQYIEEMVRNRNVGGVILFEYNMESEAQTRKFVSSLQELSLETEPAVPLFVAVDQEGGDVAHAPWVAPQPAAAEIGARGDVREARAVSEKMGRQLRRAGVNMDLAPVVDTGFGAAIGSRSFGEDPELVAKMGAASVEGFERAGLVSAAKHFPNHGPATTDSHEGLPIVRHDMATVRFRDLPPFEAAIEAGVPMVMMGHLVYPAIDPERPASLSPEAYRLLREDLDFDGVAVTDDVAMAGATGGGTPARAAVRAVKAGADLLIVSSPQPQQAAAYDAVLAAVEDGEIPRSRIRASVERVMEVKEKYPLYRVEGGL
ncbi:MAG: glycoside hydrolase family 3 N-terminal domain-containing protein [Rubrobacteraceae bacterium]